VGAFCGFLGLALAACGASATASPAASTASPAASIAGPASLASPSDGVAALKDPCILLTPVEVGAAVGYPVAPGSLSAARNACRWPGQTALGAQVAVSSGGESAFRNQATLFRATVQLSGIGDEAVQSTGIEVVVLRKGDIVVVIDAAQATKGAAAVLARLVAPRL
jgi:hypothetical protein